MRKGFFLLESNKDAVLASCRFSGLAPIRKFQCKILDDANLYREKVLVNPEFSMLRQMHASELASERSNSHNRRFVLSISMLSI